MATCHLCGKAAGFGDTVKRDWLTFCRACAPRWPGRRWALALDLFCGDGEPRPMFTIPNAAFIAPEPPAGRVRLGGHLLFTSQGICFLAVSRTLKPGMWPLWLIPLGLAIPIIVCLVLDSQANAEAARAYQMGEDDLLAEAGTVTEMLQMAERLVAIPRQEIRSIRFGGGRLRVRTPARTLTFGVKADRQARARFAPLVKQYAAALASGAAFAAPPGPPPLPR
jgi:hypothetical protein